MAKASKMRGKTNTVVADKTKLDPRNYYGFNESVWMSVYATSIGQAELMIRRACQVPYNKKLTVKPLLTGSLFPVDQNL